MHSTTPAEAPAAAAPTAPVADDVERFWRLHLLDVGTGQAILLEGADFTLLYDGGSNDDRTTGPENRLLAYLQEIRGPSGPAPRCRMLPDADTEERALTHVILSHPHQDHVALLPDVLGCFAVSHVWDSGAVTGTRAYRAFLSAVSSERGVTYHTAKPPSPTGRVRTREDEHTMERWKQFQPGERIALGAGAAATFLSARHEARDLNDASIVVRIDLGAASVLLTGDATAGERASPTETPAHASVEAHLLSRHRKLLDVDVLQVAHHGSMTSSRRRFLEAVTPKWALLSAGPMRYHDVVLPDAEVVAELERTGARVLRTDVGDADCRGRHEKIGTRADGAPGGCTAHTLRISSRGPIVAESSPWPSAPPAPSAREDSTNRPASSRDAPPVPPP